jgi:hypothetical protein
MLRPAAFGAAAREYSYACKEEHNYRSFRDRIASVLQMDARRRAAAKVGTLAKRATRQTLHLAEPDQFGLFSRDRSAFVPTGTVRFYTEYRCKAQKHSGRACETCSVLP